MGGDDRAEKARRLAELIRKLGEYRWVGVYDVGAGNGFDDCLGRAECAGESLVSGVARA